MSSRAFSAVRHVALSPVWALQLLTAYKSFLDNPLIGSRRLNEWGLHAWRVREADRLARSRRRRLAALVAPEDRADFDRDGFVLKRDFLPPAQFEALLQQVQAYRGVAREELQGNAITRRLPCDADALAAIPALRELQRNPTWRGLIRYVGSFDVEPELYIQTILSHAVPGPSDPQEVLHSDCFHATVKAWLFLTDVAPGSMCFTYVPGSHRLTPERLAWEKARSIAMCAPADRLSRRGSFRVSVAELPSLGLPPPQQLAVPANTLVVADTHGFHARGPSPGPTMRVEIWASSRRNPFLPWTGFDPWRMQALNVRRIGLLYGWLDLLDQLGIKRHGRRARAGTGAFDCPDGGSARPPAR